MTQQTKVIVMLEEKTLSVEGERGGGLYLHNDLSSAEINMYPSYHLCLSYLGTRHMCGQGISVELWKIQNHLVKILGGEAPGQVRVVPNACYSIEIEGDDNLRFEIK